MKVVHIQRLSGGHHDVSPARLKRVVGGVRAFRKTQDAYPLRVAHHVNVVGHDQGAVHIYKVGDAAAIIEQPVAIQVKVVAEIVGDFGVRDIDRRTRIVEQVGDVLLLLQRRQRRITRSRSVAIVDVRPVVHGGGIETIRVEKIRRHHQVKVLVVGSGEDAGEQLRLGAFERVVRREARGGLVGVGGDGIALAAAQDEKRGGHEGDHGQHDERDDEGDAAIGSARCEVRGAKGATREPVPVTYLLPHVAFHFHQSIG